MKANRKFVEGDEAVSAVIGVILMVGITVALATSVYIYTSGLASSPNTEKERAGVAVTTTNSMIKITLTDGGKTMGDTGYTEDHIQVLINGTGLLKTNIGGLSWTLGEALYVCGDGGSPNTPILEDDKASTTALNAGIYSITVTILDTVIFENPINIA